MGLTRTGWLKGLRVRQRNARRPERIHSRFFAKVNKSPGQGPKGDCWTWKGTKQKDGYGYFWLRGRMVGAHVASLELSGKRKRREDQVLHSCDIKLCVRPSHLSPGKPVDNTHDAFLRGRMAVGSRHWKAKLTEPNVMAIRRLRSNGASCMEIALTFGISKTQIRNIVARRAWRHV